MTNTDPKPGRADHDPLEETQENPALPSTRRSERRRQLLWAIVVLMLLALAAAIFA